MVIPVGLRRRFHIGEGTRAIVAALLAKAGERDAPLHMTEVNYAEVKSMIIRKDGAERWEEIAREQAAYNLRDQNKGPGSPWIRWCA